jgi:hypothetical protein
MIEIILQRYGIAPPTQAEIDAAMQHASGNAVDSAVSPGQLVAGGEGQTSTADTGELEYVIGCCGFIVYRARPRPSSR